MTNKNIITDESKNFLSLINNLILVMETSAKVKDKFNLPDTG